MTLSFIISNSLSHSSHRYIPLYDRQFSFETRVKLWVWRWSSLVRTAPAGPSVSPQSASVAGMRTAVCKHKTTYRLSFSFTALSMNRMLALMFYMLSMLLCASCSIKTMIITFLDIRNKSAILNAATCPFSQQIEMDSFPTFNLATAIHPNFATLWCVPAAFEGRNHMLKIVKASLWL